MVDVQSEEKKPSRKLPGPKNAGESKGASEICVEGCFRRVGFLGLEKPLGSVQRGEVPAAKSLK